MGRRPCLRPAQTLTPPRPGRISRPIRWPGPGD